MPSWNSSASAAVSLECQGPSLLSCMNEGLIALPSRRPLPDHRRAVASDLAALDLAATT